MFTHRIAACFVRSFVFFVSFDSPSSSSFHSFVRHRQVNVFFVKIVCFSTSKFFAEKKFIFLPNQILISTHTHPYSESHFKRRYIHFYIHHIHFRTRSTFCVVIIFFSSSSSNQFIIIIYLNNQIPQITSKMSESEVVNTNNNSTDEIVTKDPKNDSLKRKENEVWSKIIIHNWYDDMTFVLREMKTKKNDSKMTLTLSPNRVDNTTAKKIKQWPPLLFSITGFFFENTPWFRIEYMPISTIFVFSFFLCSFFSVSLSLSKSFLRIPIRFWIPSTMKAIIRKLNMKMAPMKNPMMQMMPVSLLKCVYSYTQFDNTTHTHKQTIPSFLWKHAAGTVHLFFLINGGSI